MSDQDEILMLKAEVAELKEKLKWSEYNEEEDQYYRKQMIEEGLVKPCPRKDHSPTCSLWFTGQVYKNLKERLALKKENAKLKREIQKLKK